ncbi:MAG TPA: methyltransferase domain-containing protein [Armatimonadota bacterium]
MGGRTWTLLKPAEVVLTSATDPDAIPFWMDLWDSSLLLAEYLWERRGVLPPSILDLGCGLGLAGLVAAEAGAWAVATDLFPEALEFARLNGLRHGVDLPCFACDWRRFALRRRFDLVVGADLLYEPTLHDALESVLLSALAPGGRAVLACPSRRYGLQFAAELEAKGWGVKVDCLARAGASEVALYEAVPPTDL